MNTFLMFVHVSACIVLVLVVLVQSGKDGGIGMMAGGGSQTVFGSSGGANFFTKFTSGVAAVFMLTSIFLTAVKGGSRTSVFGNAPVSAAPAEPAASTAPATAPAATANAPAASEAAAQKAAVPAAKEAPASAPKKR